MRRQFAQMGTSPLRVFPPPGAGFLWSSWITAPASRSAFSCWYFQTKESLLDQHGVLEHPTRILESQGYDRDHEIHDHKTELVPDLRRVDRKTVQHTCSANSTPDAFAAAAECVIKGNNTPRYPPLPSRFNRFSASTAKTRTLTRYTQRSSRPNRSRRAIRRRDRSLMPG